MIYSLQLTSSSVSGSLQVGEIQTSRALVVERASSLGEQRLTDLAQEISNLGA